MLPRVGRHQGRVTVFWPITWQLRWCDLTLWWDQRVLLRARGEYEYWRERILGPKEEGG